MKSVFRTRRQTESNEIELVSPICPPLVLQTCNQPSRRQLLIQEPALSLYL